MSSTNRGAERNRADNYPTPTWCVRRLLEAASLPGGRWLEPTAGDGAIVEAVSALRSDVQWTAIELRSECRQPLKKRVGDQGLVRIASFFDVHPNDVPSPAVVITNPPYLHAMAVLEHALRFGAPVAMLLRLNFLSSGTRAPFLRRHAPDVFVLPNRPSFTEGGRTDSIEYAWFVWPTVRVRRVGRVQVLNTTDAEERRSDPVALRLARQSL